MIRRLLALVLSLTCLVALAACNGDDGDSKSDAKKSAGGVPTYAAQDTAKGAQEFVRYWIDTLNKATVTGDTKKLRTLQKPSCTTCADFARQLDVIYRNGGHVTTQGFKVKNLVNDSSVPKPGAGVSATLTATPQTLVAKKGAKPRKLKGGDLRLRMIMVRQDDQWIMDRIDIG